MVSSGECNLQLSIRHHIALVQRSACDVRRPHPYIALFRDLFGHCARFLLAEDTCRALRTDLEAGLRGGTLGPARAAADGEARRLEHVLQEQVPHGVCEAGYGQRCCTAASSSTLQK